VRHSLPVVRGELPHQWMALLIDANFLVRIDFDPRITLLRKRAKNFNHGLVQGILLLGLLVSLFMIGRVRLSGL